MKIISNAFNTKPCHVKACDKMADTYLKDSGVTYFLCTTHDPIKGLVKLYEQNKLLKNA